MQSAKKPDVEDFCTCSTCGAPEHTQNECIVAQDSTMYANMKQTYVDVNNALHQELLLPSIIAKACSRKVPRTLRKRALFVGEVDTFPPNEAMESLKQKLKAPVLGAVLFNWLTSHPWLRTSVF